MTEGGIGKSDLFNLYIPPDTPMRKPTDSSQAEKRKEEKSNSPFDTLLTEVPDFVKKSPFHVTAMAKPRAAEREVNNLHACRPEFRLPTTE